MNTSHPGSYRALCACLCMALALLLTPIAGCEHKSPPPSFAEIRAIANTPAIRTVARANNDFGFQLLHTLENGGGAKRNVFFSPLSISSALMMTMNGAGGHTRDQMAKTLGVAGTSLTTVNQGYGALLQYLDNPDKNVELSIANALWIQSGLRFDRSFQSRCHDYYRAETTSLDLGSPAGADAINHWTDRNTHGKIAQIVSPGDLEGANAVLTDAIYFHGQWTRKFEKSATAPEPFHLEGGETKQIPMMSQTARFAYLDTPAFQAIALPYGTGRLSFYVLLPKKGHAVAGVAKSLTASSWSGLTEKLSERGVHILLPRFHVDSRMSLSDVLSRLGMGNAFGARANFLPMGLGSGEYISDVIHKATMDVDEEGTTAAAATAVIMKALSATYEPPPIEMRVDHPFFCAIRDNTTGAILFEGVVRDPQ